MSSTPIQAPRVRGKLKPSDCDMIMATQFLRAIPPDQANQLFTILREKYPEYYRRVGKDLERFGINLQRILEELKNAV